MFTVNLIFLHDQYAVSQMQLANQSNLQHPFTIIRKLYVR